MKLIKLYSNTIRLALILLLASSIALALDERSAAAQSAQSEADKLSPDLSELLRDSKGGSRINVIVQFNSQPTRLLDSLLLNLGAKVVRRLTNLNARVLRIPIDSIQTLASQSAVRFISPDRSLGALGHVTTTTGTEAVRVQTTSSLLGLIATTTRLDGTNVGIAIVDSGVDANHVSLLDSSGFSRVVVSQDFTGEGRTDDPYGHGTHVASLAAGNGQISSGAYT
ncbi:MAG: S8 family serine peptidase, partial [Acidobacteriota bacterium]|nr:S8 family serine peptidase [Acidobacteriota bacterium]